LYFLRHCKSSVDLPGNVCLAAGTAPLFRVRGCPEGKTVAVRGQRPQGC
jgi:hypothetical protein